MELGLTIPLQQYLKQRPPAYGGEKDLRLCWDLHVLRPNGKPSLFAVHASSRYAFLLYAPTEAEWSNLPALFLLGLCSHLENEGYSAEQAAMYLRLAQAPILTKTHGRRPVAFLNRAVDDLYGLPVGFDESALLQPQISQFLNDVSCHAAGHEGYGTARGFLHKDMAALFVG